MTSRSAPSRLLAVQGRAYDLLLYGATGFTGQLTASVLAEKSLGQPDLRWAIAGRSPKKLEDLADSLRIQHPGLRPPGIVVADSQDARALLAMAEETRVILSTAGPFVKHGPKLVEAAVRGGAHYADITGEPAFVDDMHAAFDQAAKANAVKLVHASGFDSLPHDLGVFFLARSLPKRPASLKLRGYVTAKGGLSGGTMRSTFGLLASDPSRAPLMKPGPNDGSLHRVDALGLWATPFASIDPVIVRRSAAALGYAETDFGYQHYFTAPNRFTAESLRLGSGLLMKTAAFKATQSLAPLLLPKPGSGPSKAKRAKSWFRVDLIGEADGQTVRAEVSGGDPGYTETSKMLAEMGLALAFDDLPSRFGQLTPAMAAGDALIPRLRAAGLRFERSDATPDPSLASEPH